MYEIHKSNTIDPFDEFDEPRLHMERLMAAKLVEFDISIRILIPLEDAGIKTLGDLCATTEKDLRKIRLIGKTSVKKLKELLDRLDLSLAK